jgi:hypothetical protein
VTAADAARYVGGRCVDLTVRAGGAAALAAAVAEKKRKYESGMRQHPHLALTVFAVGTDGSGSEWKRRLAGGRCGYFDNEEQMRIWWVDRFMRFAAHSGLDSLRRCTCS